MSHTAQSLASIQEPRRYRHRADVGRPGGIGVMHPTIGPMPNLGTGLPCQADDVDPQWWSAPEHEVWQDAQGINHQTVLSTKADADHAKRLCRDICPQAVPCLAWAVANKETGIWGGTDDTDRAKQRKGRAVAAEAQP